MPADDLYRLVGVSADAPVDRLRSAYEQAGAAATRAGDHQRALELSTAFDALPPATRTQVYRNVRHGAGPIDPWYRTGSDRNGAYRDDSYRTRSYRAGPRRDGAHRDGRRRRRRGNGSRRRRGGGARAQAGALLHRVLLLAGVALVTGFVVYLALYGRTGP